MNTTIRCRNASFARLAAAVAFALALSGQAHAADAFKCYKAKNSDAGPAFAPETVTLEDSFESKTTDVLKPSLFCNPVSVDGSAVDDPTAHLECYKIKDAAETPRQPKFAGETVHSEAGSWSGAVEVTKPSVVCVPSELDGQASALNLDSMKCYKAKAASSTASMNLVDTFEDKDTDVTKTSLLCSAASLNSASFVESGAAMQCFKIKDTKTDPAQAKFSPVTGATQNVLGSEGIEATKASLLCLPASVGCDTSGITTYAYMMAFHACSTNCMNPQNHTVYLAGSDDGSNWTLIDAFAGRAGSVPDLVYYQNYLYLFHAQGDESWVKLNACFEVVETGDVSLVSATDTAGFVDPSLVVDGTDLELFYLPGVMGGDPAGCTSYPCTKAIHSALADSTALTSFTQIAGDRASISLSSGTFSDPDLLAHSNGTNYLYVSSGQSTYVYTSATLDGTYASPDGATPRAVSNNEGGVPTAIEAPNGDVWLYVTRNSAGVDQIRRAVSTDGVTTLSSGDFSTVVDYHISAGFSSSTTTSSPSVIAWPDSSWER